MGKNSLIKSTSKKTAEKETEEKKKKAASPTKKAAKSTPPKGKKTAKKTPAKKKSAAKTKPAAKTKSTAKKTAKTKTASPKTTRTKAAAPKTPKAKAAAKKAPKKKAAAKKPAAPKKKAAPKKARSAREILFQKFETWTPDSLYKPPAQRPDRDYTAPPMIDADSAEEAERMKKLLFLRFSPEELKAAAAESAAAAEKARKAAAEKTAATQAKAEKKAAAAKPAEEKKESPEAEVSVSYTPPPSGKAEPADPMEKAFKYAIAGFAALLLLLIGYSFANTGNYYLDSANGGLKIYQGRFAPIGRELIMTLPGVKLAEPAAEVYTRSQVYPLIANFYIEKADALLAAPGLPDYEGIRRYLKEALKYATSSDLRKAIYTRLDGIELMTLLYKADVAASKDNIESLEESLDYLNGASQLEIDASQAELIDQKREAVRTRIEQLKAQEAAAGTEAAAPTE